MHSICAALTLPACSAPRSDLVPVLLWNEAHGIRFFRLSSCILPWMSSYRPEELPDWPAIQQVWPPP